MRPVRGLAITHTTLLADFSCIFYELPHVHLTVQVWPGCKVAVSKVPGDAAPQAAQCLLLSGLLQGALQALLQKNLSLAASATLLNRQWLCAHSKPGQSTSARTSQAQTPGCSARPGGRRAAPLCRTSSGLARCGPRPSRLGGRCARPRLIAISPAAFALPEELVRLRAFNSTHYRALSGACRLPMIDL